MSKMSNYLVVDDYGNILGEYVEKPFKVEFDEQVLKNYLRAYKKPCGPFVSYSKSAEYLTNRYRTIVSDGATILFDNKYNTKTVVKRAKGDRDDVEKSILWAFLKSQGYSTKDLNIFANTFDDKRTKVNK